MTKPVLIKIMTGNIPGETCPRCNNPLAVTNKRTPASFGRPPQFVGCTRYPHCDYRRAVNAQDVAKMAMVREQIELMPVEF